MGNCFFNVISPQINWECVNGFQLAWAYSNQDFPVYFRDLMDFGRRHRRRNVSTDHVSYTSFPQQIQQILFLKHYFSPGDGPSF